MCKQHDKTDVIFTFNKAKMIPSCNKVDTQQSSGLEWTNNYILLSNGTKNIRKHQILGVYIELMFADNVIIKLVA